MNREQDIAKQAMYVPNYMLLQTIIITKLIVETAVINVAGYLLE